jgi:plasmid stabilization system protein ParE
MVRKIKWTVEAINDKKEILGYWIFRNKSKIYSIKLNIYLKEVVKLLSDYSFSGHLTHRKNVRIKLAKHYLIIYRITETEIQILSIIDGRRNPEFYNQIINSK